MKEGIKEVVVAVICVVSFPVVHNNNTSIIVSMSELECFCKNVTNCIPKVDACIQSYNQALFVTITVKHIGQPARDGADHINFTVNSVMPQDGSVDLGATRA